MILPHSKLSRILNPSSPRRIIIIIVILLFFYRRCIATIPSSSPSPKATRFHTPNGVKARASRHYRATVVAAWSSLRAVVTVVSRPLSQPFATQHPAVQSSGVSVAKCPVNMG